MTVLQDFLLQMFSFVDFFGWYSTGTYCSNLGRIGAAEPGTGSFATVDSGTFLYLVREQTLLKRLRTFVFTEHVRNHVRILFFAHPCILYLRTAS